MTGIIILAAGSSSRMGQPKQQLVYKQKTLVQHAIDAAVLSEADLVIVVLGANQESIEPDITHNQVQFLMNADWQQGMSASIRAGINSMQAQHPHIDNIILMLCDQPFVDAELLNGLIETEVNTEAGIVACTYQDTIGAPVLFNKRYFAELLELEGQEGAKKLLYKYADKVKTLTFPLGNIDIDTPEDYRNLKSLE